MSRLQFAETAVAPFLFALVLSLALVPLCRAFALKFGHVAHPREDRWRRRPTALFGGVAIALTLAAGLVVFGLSHDAGVLACIGLVFALGLADDLFSLKPFTKLIVEIAIAAALLFFFRYRLNWTTSLTLDMMLTLVWVVGMTNAFNLLDNMDGLAAGVALIVGVAQIIGLMPTQSGAGVQFEVGYLALLLGATTGFLVFNFHPASIFMGDSGSLLLGFSLATVTLSREQNISANVNPLSIVGAPMLVMLIPILDTALVTASRLLSGRAPSVGGVDHSSHRLVAIGLSERSAVAMLWLLAAIGGGIGLAVKHIDTDWSGLVAVLFFLAMVIFAVYLARIRVYQQDDAKGLDPDKLTIVVVDFMYKRRVAEVLLDLCLITIAYYTAYRLRFEGDEFPPHFLAFYRSLPLVLAVQMLALFASGIYRGVWRYFGLMDIVSVGKGVMIGTVGAVMATAYLLSFQRYSRTVFVIDAILLALLLGMSRASFRLIGEFMYRRRKAATRVVIYGAGAGGSVTVRELNQAETASARILGFVDDDPRKQRLAVQGYPVLGGYASLAALITSRAVDTVVVSARMIDPERLRALEQLCGEHGVSLSRLHVGLEPIGGNEGEQPSMKRAGLPILHRS